MSNDVSCLNWTLYMYKGVKSVVPGFTGHVESMSNMRNGLAIGMSNMSNHV